MFWVNGTAFKTSFTTMVDTGGNAKLYTSSNKDTNGSYNYIILYSSGTFSRVQVTTTSKFDVTDYAKLELNAQCFSASSSASTAYIGLVSSTSAWLHNSSYKTSVSVPVSNNLTSFSLNISNISGSYYIAAQRLYTADSESSYCNFNVIKLWGDTYSYTNQS